MSKNKLKFLVYTLSIAFIFIFNSSEIRAIDYDVNVEKIENLVYGNTLKDSSIVGNSSIEGVFSYENAEIKVNTMENMNLKIIFTPNDVENYQVKEINFEADVEKRRISIVFERLLYKQYDGTKNISLPSYTYAGIVDNDISIVGTLVGELESTYVSNDVKVKLSGLTIEGSKKDYYYIDFDEHTARIFPKTLEKKGNNETIITLSDDIFINMNSFLSVEEKELDNDINRNYHSFKEYQYNIYNENTIVDVDSKIKISMQIDEKIMLKPRLEVFELTSEGEYKSLKYTYIDGNINFEIDNTSKVVFAIRNIEYDLIFFFSFILVFYLIFIIVYRYKNSKIKVY